MKRIIIVFTTLLWVVNTWAQQTKFKTTYDYNGDAEWACSILFLDSTNYLLNSFYGWQQGQGVLLIHMNNNGTVLDTREQKRPTVIYDAMLDGSLIKIDSFYYVGGEAQWPDSANPNGGFGYPFIAKFDKNRDTVWIKHIIPDAKFYLTNKIRKSKDNNLLIVGSKNTTTNGSFDYFVMKVNTSGNLLWQKTFGTLSSDERCISIEELPDSSLIISGMKQYAGTIPAAKYRPWILKLSKNGIVQVNKLFTWPSMYYGGVVVVPSKFGGYWMSGLTDSLLSTGDYAYSYYLARLDDNLNITKRSFFNSKLYTAIWDFYETDNGNIVFCGDRTDSITNLEFGYIAQIDSNGTLLWWQTYHENTIQDCYLSCVRPAPDGGFVACGTAFGLQTGSQDAWIIKTDSLGCALVNCSVGVEDVVKLDDEIDFYPNPANETIYLKSKDAIAAIKVYDITGKMVKEMKYETPITNTSLDVRGLTDGMYFMEATAKGKVPLMEKMVIGH